MDYTLWKIGRFKLIGGMFEDNRTCILKRNGLYTLERRTKYKIFLVQTFDSKFTIKIPYFLWYRPLHAIPLSQTDPSDILDLTDKVKRITKRETYWEAYERYERERKM